MFYGEVKGLTDNLSSKIGESYSPYCRAALGDKRCKLNLTDPNKLNYKVTGFINKKINSQSFISDILLQEANWFKYGYITFISGKNKDNKIEVKEFVNKRVTLAMEPIFNIEEGDEFIITVGCDKVKNTCINKFNNIINFRGEPDIPGNDRL